MSFWYIKCKKKNQMEKLSVMFIWDAPRELLYPSEKSKNFATQKVVFRWLGFASLTGRHYDILPYSQRWAQDKCKLTTKIALRFGK